MNIHVYHVTGSHAGRIPGEFVGQITSEHVDRVTGEPVELNNSNNISQVNEFWPTHW